MAKKTKSPQSNTQTPPTLSVKSLVMENDSRKSAVNPVDTLGRHLTHHPVTSRPVRPISLIKTMKTLQQLTLTGKIPVGNHNAAKSLFFLVHGAKITIIQHTNKIQRRE